MIEIIPAETEQSVQHFVTLTQEYVTWMLDEVRRHYSELDIETFAAAHSYDDIRKKYPGEHVAPDGCLLLAIQSDAVCGCVALGRLNETTCEVRTLFVCPEYRGQGVAKQLVETALSEARRLGYNYARLDTLAFMISAQTLYRSFGFYDIEAYGDIPHSLQPYIRFFEYKLPE